MVYSKWYFTNDRCRKDPAHPLKESYVHRFSSKVSFRSVISGSRRYVSIHELANAIQTKFQNHRIIVIDAVTDDEIDAIVTALVTIHDYTFVPVDPGPLTAKYARRATLNQQSQTKIVTSIGSITLLLRSKLTIY